MIEQSLWSLAVQMVIGLYEAPKGLARLICDYHGPSILVMPITAIMILGALHEVRRGRRTVALMCLGYVGALALLAGGQGTSGRYLTPLLPWAFYYLVVGLAIVLVRVRRSYKRLPLQWVMLVAILGLLGAGLGKDIRDLVRIHLSPGPWTARDHWPEVYELNEWVQQNTKPTETVLLREASGVCYWSGRRTFEMNHRAPDLTGHLLERLDHTGADFLIIRKDRLDLDAFERASGGRLQAHAQVGRYAIYRRLAGARLKTGNGATIMPR